MATADFATHDQPLVPSDQRFLLPAVDWATYRAVSRALTGRHVRLTYDGENLEFMTISPSHGNFSRILGRFVVVMTEESGLPLKSFGDMTCEREDVGRALEPDECFYIANEPAVRGKEKIDLLVDPPPDLAIEVEITRASRDRLAIYSDLGVSEVWRFDGTSLRVFQLGDERTYNQCEQSRFFPGLRISDLTDFLLRRTEMDENQLIASFREWVREQLS
jgi:Uma2 family endonuclease